MLFSTPPSLRSTSLIWLPPHPGMMLRGTAGGGDCSPIRSPCCVFFTPPSFGHLPYILLCKTPRKVTGHGRGGVVRFVQKFKQESTLHRNIRNMFIDKRLISKIQIYLSRIFTKSLNHRLYFIKKAIPLQEPPSLLLTQKGY